MKNLEKCPCCNSVLIKSQFLRKFPFKVKDNWTSFEGELKSCKSCNHLYTHYSISEDDLSNHYESKDLPSLGVSSEADIKDLKLIINMMLRNNIFVNSEKKCLEIGPGDGCFLSQMKSLGYETFFIDKSNDVTERLKVKHKTHYQNNKYGLIILRHVLEHINEPSEFLDMVIDTYTNKSSIFHIEVPCWDFLDDYTDPLIHEHIQQFTSTSLQNLLDKKNMQIINLNIIKNHRYSTTPNWRLVVNCVFKKEYKKSNNFDDYIKKYYDQRDLKIIKILQKIGDDTFIFHGASMQLGDLLINKKYILENKKFIICDGNKNRLNEDFYGYKLKNPNNMLAETINTILCFSTFYEQIEKDWIDLGFDGDFIVF